MKYWYRGSRARVDEFKGYPGNPPQRHPVPEGIYYAICVGTVLHGFDANWRTRQEVGLYDACRMSTLATHFLCVPGDYIMLNPEKGGWGDAPAGEIFFCHFDGITHVGTLTRHDQYSVGDTVIGHLDPEALRRRLTRRRDLVDFWQPRDVTLTPRNGPLRDLAPGDRFIMSWGEHAEVVEQGPRSTRFRLCDVDPNLPAIQLSSRETQIVTCRKGEKGLVRAA